MTLRPTFSAETASEVGIHPPLYRLPAGARIGRVRLAVSDLAQSLAFYTSVIGLRALPAEAGQNSRIARLGVDGADDILLELESLPGVHPLGRRTRLGLYHTVRRGACGSASRRMDRPVKRNRPRIADPWGINVILETRPIIQRGTTTMSNQNV